MRQPTSDWLRPCFSQATAAALAGRAAALESAAARALEVCLHCGGGGGSGGTGGGLERLVCVSLDCALFFQRRKLEHEYGTARELAEAGLSALF